MTHNSMLQYRVIVDGDLDWGHWQECGDFAGTRGQSKSLVGFTVRLKKEFQDHYILRAFGRFAGSFEPIEVSDGEDCLSGSKGLLCGMQIELANRSLKL